MAEIRVYLSVVVFFDSGPKNARISMVSYSELQLITRFRFVGDTVQPPESLGGIYRKDIDGLNIGFTVGFSWI